MATGKSGQQELTINLYRDSLHSPWGFRLRGGVDFDGPLTVAKVEQYKAAAGLLYVGDIVLQINGQDARKMTHTEALDCILTAGSNIRFAILRGAAQTLPSTSTSNSTLSKTSEPSTPLTSPKHNDVADEKTQIPRNYQLASLMNAALRGKGETLKPRRQMSNILYKSHIPTGPPKDVVSYLPQPPPRRRGSRDSGSGRDQTPRTQTADSLLRSPSVGSSGRSSPASMIELRGTKGAPLMGYINPPGGHPNSTIVHAQYNSPMGLYSANNVVDTLEKTTGSKINWLQQGPAKYLDDIRESPTYKFVQELEGKQPRAQSLEPYEQTTTIKNLNRFFRNSGYDVD